MAVVGLTQGWVAKRLPERPARAHKGSFGRLLIVAGSLEYAGAALLTGLGAIRAGVGLACLATPEAVGTRLMGLVPELTSMLLIEEAPGLTAPAGWRQLATEAAGYQAFVIGPGLGRQPATLRRARNFIGGLRLPAVVDADGLTALAEVQRWWQPLRAPLVLTPHAGEFARLMRMAPGESLADDDAQRAEAARDAATSWGQIVVLKGAHTVIASPTGDLLRSDIATPALATAGSGDVLAGAIGAFLAAGMDPFEAAGCGVAVHGAAGLLAEDRIGQTGVVARDIANLLPAAIQQLRGGRQG
ncbi:MAG TPA: NAD(P)H-hydrate dehydratase [Candidatus Limnocylindria bacterium]|jgi:NAD(P)H-hydrate epimerase|nr:NAD(P)H-hydrate dehydratase [Candidatus Limnocylindria bacterium]